MISKGEGQLLDNLDSEKLKKMSGEKIRELSGEIREFLIENVSRTGGHLASNLGVVELTLAIHRVFDLPKDKVIFDVGHQSYVHKLLSGRRDFSALRHENGLSGFPKISESEYDAFGTGHSSTSLSAGLGIANAMKLKGSDAYTVVVIGDGAATGGLVYEAINNCRRDLNLIVILNENEMSISKNVGNVPNLISKIRSTKGYFNIKDKLSDFTESIPFIGKPTMRVLRKLKRILKLNLYSFVVIEGMGLKYYGPIDGNDFEKTELLLKRAKKEGGSAFIHLRTTKGKGYKPAEENPENFHALTAKKDNFDDGKAEIITSESFSKNAGEVLTQIAIENKRVCAISAAMISGTGLTPFFKQIPERAFDVGIAEGHAVTFGAGLAAAGEIPVFAVYSSFLQRAYDNILHDISLQNLHMVFLIDRAGLAPEDGATHHGIWDVAYLSHMNNVELYAPISLKAQERYINESIDGDGICAVRYCKGGEDTSLASALGYVGEYMLSDFSAQELKAADIIVLTYGRIAAEALCAVKRAREYEKIKCALVVCEKLLPYSDITDVLSEAVGDVKRIIILEEGIKRGGFGVDAEFSLSGNEKFSHTEFKVLAISEPPEHGDLHKLYERVGISSNDVYSAIVE